jgi:hypothetical protein
MTMTKTDASVLLALDAVDRIGYQDVLYATDIELLEAALTVATRGDTLYCGIAKAVEDIIDRTPVYDDKAASSRMVLRGTLFEMHARWAF